MAAPVNGRRRTALALLAVGVVVFGSVMAQRLQDPSRRLDAAGLLLAAVAAVALPWLRRFPPLALAVVVAAAATYLAVGYPYGPVQICLLIAFFAVGRTTGLRRSAIGCGVAAVVVGVAVAPRTGDSGQLFPGAVAIAWTASWLLLPWSLGALLRLRADAERSRRDQAVADAVTAERMRLAREVHDVAGHGFALIALQADVALLTLDDQPAQARTSLAAIRAASGAALTELRASLEVFGAPPEGAGSPPRGPLDLPGQLAEVVDRAGRAGLPVELAVDPAVRAVGTGRARDEAVVRVVQESLSNVIHHAGAAPARVTVDLEGDLLRVTVTDLGTPPATGRRPGTPGSGLAGLAERLRLVGGDLVAGPRPAGGYAVTATVPAASGGSAESP
ncbi:sensor histidine kinase [Blastococcus sp. URHD0036]|uniref:sensor histidine kinase n=1 Tax=Blastococcus sp. URHD0036 TaxID=1380356 RepID=UPI00054E91FF|nr:histidine kinase [Blastococcus sp. URHD0036]